MDVEIAGLTTTVTRGARGAPAETVYERIKMMLKTHEATMPNLATSRRSRSMALSQSGGTGQSSTCYRSTLSASATRRLALR